jgi:hypothetical protein
MTNVDFISKVKEKTLLGRRSEWVLITICLQEANNLPERILLKFQSMAKRLDNYLNDPSDFYSHNDEDYPIDWAVGDFS